MISPASWKFFESILSILEVFIRDFLVHDESIFGFRLMWICVAAMQSDVRRFCESAMALIEQTKREVCVARCELVSRCFCLLESPHYLNIIFYTCV